MLLLPACGDATGPGGQGAPHALWIGETGVILDAGEAVRLTASAMATPTSLVQSVTNGTWWSDATEVVRVSGNGDVEAIAPGRATVWVEVDGRRDSATVVVRTAGDAPVKRWRSVAVGWRAACALSEAGRAYCWGWNYYGELGDGNRREFTQTLAPVAVAGEHLFREIDVGEMHVCALEIDGTPWCWGHLGLTGAGFFEGAQHARSVPERVGFGGTFAQIRATFNHTCGLDPDGVAYCWGNNFSGQLGLGTRDGGRLEPTRVATELRFAQVETASKRSCGLTQDGRTFCWGSNQPPLVGHDAQRLWYELPERVTGLPRLVELAPAAHCGRDEVGQTWCWGWGPDVPMWPHDPTNPHAPSRLLEDPGYERIYVGRRLVCGLLPDGAAQCSGSDLYGRLGADRPLTETWGEYRAIPIPSSSRPVPVAGGHRWKQLSLGERTTCGVTLDGELYCWGSNQHGLLGIGLVEGNFEEILDPAGQSPVPVRVADPL